MAVRRRVVVFVLGVLLPAGLSCVVAWLCIYRFRQYGLTLFLAVPLLLGLSSTAVLRLAGAQGLLTCVGVACLSGATLSTAFLVLGWEGAICIAMAAPLAGPFIILGALAGYLVFHRAQLQPLPTVGGMFVLILIAAAAESRVQRVAPLFLRTDSMIVNASASEVWTTIVTMENLPSPDDWFLRTGVACPRSARVVRPGAGGARVCTLSTGEYMEAIEIWRPGERIRWRALSTPPPLKEINPLHAEVNAPHLHGFYEATSGEIVIDQLGPSSVSVTRKTWYRHNLYPAAYWKQWCDFGAARAHQFVLREWKSATERSRTRSL